MCKHFTHEARQSQSLAEFSLNICLISLLLTLPSSTLPWLRLSSPQTLMISPSTLLLHPLTPQTKEWVDCIKWVDSIAKASALALALLQAWGLVAFLPISPRPHCPSHPLVYKSLNYHKKLPFPKMWGIFCLLVWTQTGLHHVFSAGPRRGVCTVSSACSHTTPPPPCAPPLVQPGGSGCISGLPESSLVRFHH